MSKAGNRTLEQALRELARTSPGVPLLALGQTIFWDEPMKGGVALLAQRLGLDIRLVAGIHDTDYFAKLPSGARKKGQYRVLPHNDTTTRGLWSAAAEFSTLFGSETVITRDLLTASGLKVARLREARPNILDEATEAWGWRGVVSLDESAPITAEVPLSGLTGVLCEALKWALDSAVSNLVGDHRENARELADGLQARFCDHADQPGQSLAAMYQQMLPEMYAFCAGEEVPLETTRTTELLRFGPETVHLPRFDLLRLFVSSDSRAMAKSAYDQAIRGGSGQYELSRFGTGAIPFDIIIPGVGRGTIRLGNRGVVFMTPKPQFLSLRRPIESLEELAQLIAAKFGDRCAIVGKAVTLIGMLAREYSFLFHGGASGYVKSSRRLHQLLAEAGKPLELNPILRVEYRAWDELSSCCAWFHLPDPFSHAFGTEELCAPSFSSRWRGVVEDQRSLLVRLSQLRRPMDLIRFLDGQVGGNWRRLVEEYEGLHARLNELQQAISEIQARRNRTYLRMKELRVARVAAERAKGEHFREFIFEKAPTEDDFAMRRQLTKRVEELVHEMERVREERRQLRHEQVALVNDPQVLKAHDRRESIELEAELKRMRMIRGAVTSSSGLENSSRRPSAWWFPLVCPDGDWFRSTIDGAEAYLEELA